MNSLPTLLFTRNTLARNSTVLIWGQLNPKTQQNHLDGSFQRQITDKPACTHPLSPPKASPSIPTQLVEETRFTRIPHCHWIVHRWSVAPWILFPLFSSLKTNRQETSKHSFNDNCTLKPYLWFNNRMAPFKGERPDKPACTYLSPRGKPLGSGSHTVSWK